MSESRKLPRQQQNEPIFYCFSQISERKKVQVGQTPKGNTDKLWGANMGILHISCKRSIYAMRTVKLSRVTTRKLYKTRGIIQYLNTFIEVKRFERCISTQVQFVLEKSGR
jgi:hypothetical protein